MIAGPRPGATVRLAAFSAGCVIAARILLASGGETLAVPLGSTAELETWVAAASPAEMAMAVVRGLGIAACGYLLAITALGVIARLVRARGLATTIDRISPAVVRRLVSGGTGAGLVLGTLVAAVPAPDLPGTPGTSTVAAGPRSPGPAPSAAADAVTATMTRLPSAAATMTRRPEAPPAAPAVGEATMTRLDVTPRSATMTRIGADPPPGQTPAAAAAADRAAAPPAPAARAVLPAETSAPADLPTTPSMPVVDAATWVIEGGDSLWSIAEDVVRSDRRDAPDRTVSRYWQALVDANRSHLVDPDNPDLLVPGQQLTLPPFAP